MSFGIEDIRAARERVAPYVFETPLLRLANLDQYLGCQVYAKAECMQKTGSFKLRGAMNKLLSLTEEQLQRGVVAVSSGNHGRAVAYAAGLFGFRATVVIPDTAARVKVNAMRALGAEIIQCKAEDRYGLADELCRERGAVLMHPFDDPFIMAGQGTAGLELVEQGPAFDAALVPVSGGGLLSGIATAVKALSPSTKVYGICPEILPHFKLSLEQGKPVSVPQRASVADALASRQPGKLTLPVIRQNCDGIVTVAEDDILRGQKLLLTEGKLLAEPASAIGAAALLAGSLPVSADDRVCLLISGGNVGLEQLARLQEV